ncbi:MAG TPA: VacJ family lipoprotein [Thermodesulfovibrionales bacterium]|nr:VacJ family lipoprotein [Thermodesulfovibrionales bacterium]
MKRICGFSLIMMLVSYPAILWAQTFNEPDATVHTSPVPAHSEADLIDLPRPSSLSDAPVKSEAPTIIVAQAIAGEEIPSRHLASSAEKEAPEEGEEEVPLIADPLAPINKAMYHVNDKLYFWLLKPVTQVYSHTMPEPFRVVFSNAFDNLWAPSRIVNNLLQLRFKAAGNEFIRFIFNTIAGIGGLGDVATPALGIKKQEADFGQTLGHYGAGHGFYLVLPLFGPSSLRDGVGLAADRFMYPLSYISSSNLTFGEAAGIFAGEKVNDASFHIGEYESFKESAIDPYVAMRDAFVQYRQKKVEDSKKPPE